MRLSRLVFFGVALFSATAFAALHFPALSGRVVDNAHVLSAETEQTLDSMLADYQRGTTNQVVVVTLESLQNTSIEDYGYQLGRSWKIGQKGKDNGVLLIVAPAQHKVRIEVGYGLEPVLTDAAASSIVNQIIVPEFRAGNMQQGIIDGTKAILSVLGGQGMPAAPAPSAQGEPSPAGAAIVILFIICFFWFAYHHPVMAAYMLSTTRFGGGGGGSFGGGGGFSGGGGSFGGGGASGGW